ncbi:transposase domain-containing protein [Luteolibacter ambystomatis]|uniref:Transposase domain-containing protein n=1 Tax=Luteolibacter ambystomatis TaxID=2824561 RepID=A0A975PGR2_9BACT|nr:transposase domain-containing protein [Luteolibacter ambystomatis]QUE52989.1 transposase domain-containing protein [Luteolibacter ambystomatis]
MGAKNWLFIGREAAGDKAAILYTVVENCRRLGIDPKDYLTDVLTRLPGMQNHEVAALTPSNWLKTQRTVATRRAA